MRRTTRIGAACVPVLLVACIPELQPEYPPSDQSCDGGGQALSYDDAPESFKTPELEDAILLYEALTGEWAVDLACPPDEPPARTLHLAVETKPRSEIRFVANCQGRKAVVTSCGVSLSGAGFPELNGQSVALDVLFLPGPGVCAGQVYPELDYQCGPENLDSSYDPSLAFVAMALAVDSTNAVSGALIYGSQPFQTPQGGMAQQGYDCRWASARRVDP